MRMSKKKDLYSMISQKKFLNTIANYSAIELHRFVLSKL